MALFDVTATGKLKRCPARTPAGEKAFASSFVARSGQNFSPAHLMTAALLLRIYQHFAEKISPRRRSASVNLPFPQIRLICERRITREKNYLVCRFLFAEQRGSHSTGASRYRLGGRDHSRLERICRLWRNGYSNKR